MYSRQLLDELRLLTPRPTDITRTTALAAVEASVNCHATAIITLSLTGRSACAISAYRPRCPIIVVTRDPVVARQLNLYRGIYQILDTAPIEQVESMALDQHQQEAPQYQGSMWWADDVDRRVWLAFDAGIDRGFFHDGSVVVVATGWHAGTGHTNTVRVVTVPPRRRNTSSQ